MSYFSFDFLILNHWLAEFCFPTNFAFDWLPSSTNHIIDAAPILKFFDDVLPFKIEILAKCIYRIGHAFAEKVYKQEIFRKKK